VKTLKLSHSILAAWKEARYEDAVGYYLGKDLPATPQMELGKLYDEKWTAYVEKHQQLPDELGGDPLENPRTQIKYQLRIPLSDDYEILLRGVPDLITLDKIIDFKCGRTESNGYVSKMQLDYYSLFLPHIKEGMYICYNPYTKTCTRGIKFLSQENRDNALNDIVTFGGEMLQYLLANRLFRDWKPERIAA
jgi:hypothetical protein